MSNLRMVVDNHIDTSVLTATNTNTTLTEENLKNVSRAKVTRSLDATTQEISGTFNEEKRVSAVIIGRHNLELNTEYTIELFTNADKTGLIYTSGSRIVTAEQIGSNLWAWGDFLWGAVSWGADRQIEAFSPKANLVHWLPDIYSAKSFKITINQPTGSRIIPYMLGYLPVTITPGTTPFEIGRLIMGEYIEPTYNLSFGHNISWTESTKQYRTDAGTLRSDIGLPNRKFEFDIGTMTETDRTVIQNALRKVGLRKDFFISLFPDDPDITKTIDYSGIVKLTKVPSYAEYAPKYYKSKYVMEEV